jgi:hypothetical protein
LYDLIKCSLCNKQYIRETTITEYNDNGEYYCDVKIGTTLEDNKDERIVSGE